MFSGIVLKDFAFKRIFLQEKNLPCHSRKFPISATSRAVSLPVAFSSFFKLFSSDFSANQQPLGASAISQRVAALSFSCSPN